jgi:protocatechuate 3,4-dioxygenase beta subunit
LNLILVIITVLAVLFGVGSFVLNNTPAPAPNQSARHANLSEPEGAAGRPGGQTSNPGADTLIRPDRPPNRPVETPANPARPPESTPKLEIIPAAGSPGDSGDARIAGRVLGTDGKPAAGATVIARRANLELEPPQLRDHDLERYRDAVAKFLEAAARERRVTSTDAEGRFVFQGLDARLAYHLSASTEGASGSAERVAAGDSPTIILASEGVLRGRVQTADGRPVTSFRISTWRPQRQWEARTQTVSDEQGRFAVPARPGAVLCRVEAPGLTQGEAQEFTVGANTPEAVITLGRAAVVAGTVRDAAGNALAGANVSLGARGEGGGRRGWNEGGWQQGQSVTTDSQGRYRFDSLEPKTHTITASFGEFHATQNIEAREGDNTLDFSLEAGARVVLKLTGASGEPVQADEAWFQGKGGQWTQPARLPSREPGRVEFAGLRPGEYTATITAAGWPALRKQITVKEGENLFEYQFAQGATLSGTVTGSGGMVLTGVGVRLRKDDEDAYGGWGTGRYAQVGSDGRFKLGPAEPGQWKLEVYVPDGWKLVHSSVVTLAVGDNTQNITIDSAGSVTVTVLDENGAPMPWADVQLRGEQAYNGRTDQGGKAVISFVAPGSYQVYASSRALSTRTHTLNVRNGDNTLSLQLQKANCSRITHVYPDTQAARLGVQVGDLVFEYNGEQVTSWRSFSQAIRKTRSADDVVMLLERNGQILTFQLKGGTVGIEGADGVR